VTFGLWFPNTAVAKAQGVPDPRVPLADLAAAAGGLLATVAVLAALAWWARPLVRDHLAGLAVTAALALAAYSVLERDWMGQLRFAAPLWPVAALLGVLAVAALRSVLGAVVLAGAVAATTVTASVPDAAAFRADPQTPACLVAQIDAREITAYADIADLGVGTFLVPDVGATALLGRMRVVDLAGLTDPVMARYWSSRDMAALREHVYEQVRPTFVSAHGSWASDTGVLADPRLGRDYAQISGTAGAGVWVRRDVLPPGALERMRAYRAGVAQAAESEVRAAPRGYCTL
jgi:hypothetical protein